MKKNLKMTPEGTKDFLFAECSAMDYICTSIEKVFVKGVKLSVNTMRVSWR